MAKRRKRGLGTYERDILHHLTFGDLLYAHLCSATSTKRFYRIAQERATERYRRKLAIERLKELKYIEQIGERLLITNDGRNALNEVIDTTRKLLLSKEWDLKWRVASYDIPEKYASLRNKVRDILKKTGFVKLQNSIWVFPHHCEDLVQLIKKESQLNRYILYGVLEYVEDEPRLKKLFKLR